MSLDTQEKTKSFIRDNANLICDTFMELYIFNTIELAQATSNSQYYLSDIP